MRERGGGPELEGGAVVGERAEDDEDVPESGIRADGSRRPRRARGPGVIKGVDDVHRCYVKTS